MAAQGVTIRTYRGDEITPDLVDPMFRFYLETIHSRAWGRQYLNRSPRFEALGERARELGFTYVASGPLVRSSYRAGELLVEKTLRDRTRQGS